MDLDFVFGFERAISYMVCKHRNKRYGLVAQLVRETKWLDYESKVIHSCESSRNVKKDRFNVRF